MAAVMTATGTPAFESLTATVAAAAIGTSAAIMATTGATERPLKARTRVATDTRGIAWKIFARSGWAATGSRSTRFAGKQDIEIFGSGCFDNGSAGGGRDHFGFGVNVLALEMFLR
jgi:hypothetical protein